MKYFLLLSFSLFLLVGCSENSREEEEAIKYSVIKIQVEGKDSYNEDDLAMRQPALIEIYEGDNIEKRDVNKDGIAYDVKNNKDVKAVAAQDGRWYYVFDKAKVGMRYFVFVKTRDYPSLDFNEGAYSYTSIIAPLNENEEFEINKVFTYNARLNVQYLWPGMRSVFQM